ncbi:MAG: PfkB family carbohydrate kinase [Liquorilactobacillus hordei]|uniref:PfkB family carbohydrate kinase n=1 Tax=Lactobacillaceae TaxID=33958 RepID=UPI001CC21DAF|nr:PfkB family carbohydrate kinase [Lentilactobacillus hilgardii]
MNVLGIGDNVVDIYLPEKVGFPGGNALNFTAFAKKLGAESEFIGTFGTDLLGKKVKEALDYLNVKYDKSKTFPGDNGFTRVMLDGGDRRFVFSNHGGVSKVYGIFAQPDNFINRDLVHFNVNGNCDNLIDYVNREKTKIVYDFSDFEIGKERLAKLISSIDLACFSMPAASKESITKFCGMLKAINPRINVLCTSGSKGAHFFEARTGRLTAVKAKKIQVKDTMGAGDAFITYFSLNFFNKERVNSVINILNGATEFAASQCLVDGSFGYGFEVK